MITTFSNLEHHSAINMKTIKLFFTGLVFTLLLCTEITFAQGTKSAPLFDYFKDNADSTIVLSHLQNINLYPEYFIVSKKGDTINMYTYRYRTPIQIVSGIDVPGTMAKRIWKENMAAASKAPDINLFFEVKVLNKDSLNQLWIDLRKVDVWKIKDDKVEGAGCPIIPGKPTPQIYDAGGPIFKLITKSAIRELTFYAPSYFEKECPGRAGRIAALKTEKIFIDYFTTAGEKEIGQIRKHRPNFKNSM